MPTPELPHVPFPFVLLSLFILGLFGLSLSLWIHGLYLWFSGQLSFPKPEPRRMQPWGLIDLLVAFAILIGLQFIGTETGVMLQFGPRPKPDVNPTMPMLIWISTIYSFAIVIVSVWIAIRCNIRVADIGWSLRKWFQDLRLAVLAFVLITPPIYLLMAIATYWSGKKYNHPIFEMTREDPWMILPAIWMAVVLAPLGEEFAFRVLFQGFLESMSKGRFTFEKFLMGRAYAAKSPVYEIESKMPSVEEATSVFLPVEGSENLLPVEDTVIGGHGSRLSEINFEDSYIPWWPIVVSGVLFGLAHYSYGMSWLPLSILGIALGWLYRITNRIWPSLTVHFLVNFLAMISMTLTVLFGDPTNAIE